MLGRLAGQALRIPGSLFSGMSKAEIAGRLAPDAIFGVMAGAMTPGDIGDKIIAGSGQAIGGGLGGLGLSKLGSKVGIGGMGSMGLDMAGSLGGDYAGMYAADQLMKGKDLVSGGKGQTPWEKMSEQQQQEQANQLREQILWQYGLVPGTREQFAVM